MKEGRPLFVPISLHIDVPFLDRQERVVRMEEAVAPFRALLGGPGAWQALELPAGALAASAISPGDLLRLAEVAADEGVNYCSIYVISWLLAGSDIRWATEWPSCCGFPRTCCINWTRNPVLVACRGAP